MSVAAHSFSQIYAVPEVRATSQYSPSSLRIILRHSPTCSDVSEPSSSRTTAVSALASRAHRRLRRILAADVGGSIGTTCNIEYCVPPSIIRPPEHRPLSSDIIFRRIHVSEPRFRHSIILSVSQRSPIVGIRLRPSSTTSRAFPTPSTLSATLSSIPAIRPLAQAGNPAQHASDLRADGYRCLYSLD